MLLPCFSHCYFEFLFLRGKAIPMKYILFQYVLPWIIFSSRYAAGRDVSSCWSSSFLPCSQLTETVSLLGRERFCLSCALTMKDISQRGPVTVLAGWSAVKSRVLGIQHKEGGWVKRPQSIKEEKGERLEVEGAPSKHLNGMGSVWTAWWLNGKIETRFHVPLTRVHVFGEWLVKTAFSWVMDDAFNPLYIRLVGDILIFVHFGI